MRNELRQGRFADTISSYKMVSVLHFYERLPENQGLIVDVLRQIVIENLPPNCNEKLAFGVPFFYGNKGICIIWPAAIPRGGIAQGVLLGFWQGNKLKDNDEYLTHGSNKKIFYRIFNDVYEIDEV